MDRTLSADGREDPQVHLGVYCFPPTPGRTVTPGNHGTLHVASHSTHVHVRTTTPR